jgi:uncharacterized membrane protein YhhN
MICAYRWMWRVRQGLAGRVANRGRDMPKRALIERRPWLLASLASAIAYFLVRGSAMPELYQLVLKGVPLVFLAVYALLRHHDAGSRLIALVMAISAAGAMVLELWLTQGLWILVLGHGIAIALFLRFRRDAPAGSQKAAAVALLLLTPLIAWTLPADRALAPTIAIYSLALGGMAAAACMSAFPRYRVGIGATLAVLAGLIGFAQFGPLADSALPDMLAWPLYYVGQFLICTGVIQTLHKWDDPD